MVDAVQSLTFSFQAFNLDYVLLLKSYCNSSLIYMSIFDATEHWQT